MNDLSHTLRVVAGGKDQPDFFVRTGYLSIEVVEVIARIAQLALQVNTARQNRDMRLLAEVNHLMSACAAQLRALTACIDAHIHVERSKNP